MTETWQCSDEELLAALGRTQTALNAAWVETLTVIAEVERRGLAAPHGYRDTADLLRTAQRVGRAEAKARVRAAREVLPGRTLGGSPAAAELPVLAAAVAEAAVSAEHVRVVQTVLASVPPHQESHRAALEADLTQVARDLDPDAVRRVGLAAVAMLDPDGPRPRDGDPTRTHLSLVARGEGYDARGWLAKEDAAILRTALSPLSAPRPATPAHREDGGDLGGGGRDSVDRRSEGSGDAGSGAATDDGAAEPAVDPRTRAQRQGDALVELARRALATGALPTEAGVRPQVTVTVPLQVLQQTGNDHGAGLLAFGDDTLPAPVDAETARRWACDAAIIPVVLGSAGEPLDIGRESRLVPCGMRRALVQRDGGCAFPGCPCPAPWTDAHHIRHWAHHGTTAMHNLVLLCPRHHRLLHHTEWRVEITDGFPLFHPPPWIRGGPRRNPLHRPDMRPAAPLDVLRRAG